VIFERVAAGQAEFFQSLSVCSRKGSQSIIDLPRLVFQALFCCRLHCLTSHLLDLCLYASHLMHDRLFVFFWRHFLIHSARAAKETECGFGGEEVPAIATSLFELGHARPRVADAQSFVHLGKL
jgi:hypothetical protein